MIRFVAATLDRAICSDTDAVDSLRLSGFCDTVNRPEYPNHLLKVVATAAYGAFFRWQGSAASRAARRVGHGVNAKPMHRLPATGAGQC